MNLPVPTPTEFQAIRGRIAECIQELPPLPAVVSRLLTATQNEDISFQELERYLNADPALAAKVLRVSNSAYYGMTRQIASLGQAVVVLGLQQLRNLMLSISASNLLKPMGPTQKELHERFWFRSISVALASQILAKRCRFSVADQEYAYTGGLLSDIGILFLWTNFAETYREVERRVQVGESRQRVEIELLGLSHAQVGQVLAHFWKFPRRLEQLIGQHESVTSATTEILVPVLRLAEAVVMVLDSNRPINEIFGDDLVELCPVDEADWPGIVQELLAKRSAYQGEFAKKAA